MVTAGTVEKGDAFVSIESANEREIQIRSKLQRIYGEAVRKTVEDMTSDLVAKIEVVDMGALDWVLRARIESALRKFRGEEE